RDLVIRVDVYSGDTLSFQGQSIVPALRPGQIFPFEIEADPVGETTLPTLNLDQNAVSVFEGDNFTTTTNMTFTVELSELANGDVTADYTASDITATAEIPDLVSGDYAEATGTVTIPAGTLQGTFDITVLGDTSVEPDETFSVTLSNVSANAALGTATNTIGTIISDDFPGRLNDTGIIQCADIGITGQANNLDCAVTGATATVDGVDIDDDVVPAAQDAHFGRDAALNNPVDGAAGFNFTKLDASGTPLPDQTQPYSTQPWSCVMDNYTGIIWEVKTRDNGLQDSFNRYTWYNSSGINDGGSAGSADPGTGTSCNNTGNCDTEKYTTAINTSQLCGFIGWHLPTVEELLSIINNSQLFPGGTSNADYFPNAPFTEGPAELWTSASIAETANGEVGSSNLAWIVANDGTVSTANKGFQRFVRLVSNGTFSLLTAPTAAE
ncbi:hypothetical protein MNBD_GAMMA11-134, partial [hydrothermal vent metagenome]